MRITLCFSHGDGRPEVLRCDQLAFACLLYWSWDILLLTNGVDRLQMEPEKPRLTRLTALQTVMLSSALALYSHPPMSLRLLSLLLQLRRRPFPCHIPLLNIRRPQCCSHRIRKCEQNTRNRHQFQQDSCNPKANTQLSAHFPNPKSLALVPRGDNLPSVRRFILFNMLLPLRTIPLLQLKIS